MRSSASNRYVVVHPWNGDEIAWNPHDPHDLPTQDCAYIGGIIRAMERRSGAAGLTFYVTPNVDRLPSYGDDVVAIVLGDEWCRTPRYAADVRSVFKTYGTRLPVNWRALAHPTPYELVAFAQDVRTSLRRLPYAAASARAYLRRIGARNAAAPRIYDIPLGYYRQIPVPFVPITQRRFDVYFAGSILNSGKSAFALGRVTPKFLSRAAMQRELEALAARRSDLVINTASTGGFAQAGAELGSEYSHKMMDSKLCLVPRGTSLETYRYFEGLRAGCVVITERLPHRRYYDGSPTVRVRSWAELGRLIPALLADTPRLEALSRASHEWWLGRCSEDVIGAFLAERIGSFGAPTAAAHQRLDAAGAGDI